MKMLRRIVVCSAVIAVLMPLSFATASARAEVSLVTAYTNSDTELGIVSQPFHILTSVNARFVLEATPKVLARQNTQLQFQLHRRVASPDSMTDIANRSVIAGIVDTVSLPLPRVPRDSNGNLAPLIPIATSSQDIASLTISFDGVYPLTIRIVDSATGEVVSSVLTFLNKRDAKLEQQDVRATTLVRITAPPSLLPDGTIEIVETTRTMIRSSIALLRDVSSSLTVAVQPELMWALASSPLPDDQELLRSLAEQLQRRSLTATTFAHTDVSLMAASNLKDEFIRQLRLGEEALNFLFPSVSKRQNTYVSDSYLDTPGVSLLRQAGISSLILLPGSQVDIRADAPRGMVARPNGTDNQTMSAVMADAKVALAFDAATSASRHIAYRAVAELLVKRDTLIASGQNPDLMRLVMATSTGRPDNDSLLSTATAALAASPGIDMTDMGSPRVVYETTPFLNFRPSTPNDGENRRGGLIAARSEINAVSSMLDDSDPRRLQWEYTFAIGAGTIATKPAEFITGVRAQLRTTRRSVTVTTPKTITLSSRTGSIRLQLRNDSESSLSVRVRLSSAKLQLTDADRTVTLAAGGTTEVVVPATTRTNGSFPVAVWVSTPRGNIEVAPFVTITARVTAIAGFGQLVSISLLLILLAWWWSNRRKAHHEGRSASTVSS
jgi:hypothetical protein